MSEMVFDDFNYDSPPDDRECERCSTESSGSTSQTEDRIRPEMPSLDECLTKAHVAVIYDLSYREITAVKAVYEFIRKRIEGTE
jgi:hypothetical protein